MIKTGGDVAKGFIKTGGDLADKMIAKSGDFAAGMMKLTSKLSDDIGMMADRIGDMAERIERTEALMANLTAALADRKLDLTSRKPGEMAPTDAVTLQVGSTEASRDSGPELSISGNPSCYLLYVSASPLFQEGGTVVSHINTADEFASAWRRSIDAVKRVLKESENSDGSAVVSVAVKAGVDAGRFTALSNSVDISVSI